MQQTEFKVGDKIREISTGDEGVISHDIDWSPEGTVYVDWKTGDFIGMTLYTNSSKLELVEPTQEITFEQAMQTLLQPVLQSSTRKDLRSFLWYNLLYSK